MTRIVLVHAMQASIAPIADAFAAHWPDAELVDLLDSSLATDRAEAGALTEQMTSRIAALSTYARDTGADAILFTCSAFGPAIDAAAALRPLPVHKPNTAMIDEARTIGGRVGLLSSFQPTLDSMLSEFPTDTDVTTALCDGALAALASGDGAAHDRIAARTAARELAECDTIALAQFSLARAAPAVAKATGKRVLTTPDSAVVALKSAHSRVAESIRVAKSIEADEGEA